MEEGASGRRRMSNKEKRLQLSIIKKVEQLYRYTFPGINAPIRLNGGKLLAKHLLCERVNDDGGGVAVQPYAVR